MDQTTPANQSLLRHQRERREDPNLDCGIGVRAGGDRAQAVGTGVQSLPDSTDSEPHAIRENPHFMRPSGHRRGCPFHRKRQPTDSVRLLTGQQWYGDNLVKPEQTMGSDVDASRKIKRCQRHRGRETHDGGDAGELLFPSHAAAATCILGWKPHPYPLAIARTPRDTVAGTLDQPTTHIEPFRKVISPTRRISVRV